VLLQDLTPPLGGYDKKTRKQKLSGKAGFEKETQPKKLGFFVGRRKGNRLGSLCGSGIAFTFCLFD
jgi:hypothetical protein